jgi:hypothetical protein
MKCMIENSDTIARVENRCRELLQDRGLPSKELPTVLHRACHILDSRVHFAVTVPLELADTDDCSNGIGSILNAIIAQACIDAIQILTQNATQSPIRS